LGEEDEGQWKTTHEIYQKNWLGTTQDQHITEQRNTAYTTHLSILLPNLRMLFTQDLGAKVTSILRRDGPGISLSPNLDS
jgi:hypothetical protein